MLTSKIVPVITIDGPSGSGKGTMARLLAKQLRWHYLESGALYRVLAFVSLQDGIQVEDPQSLTDLALNLPVKFEFDVTGKILWSSYDITDEIHTEQCGNLASKIAAIPEVREALVSRQRGFAILPGLVTDGRDMGTVIFPEALLKFYIIADRSERARRRHVQLKEKGINDTLEHVLADLAERDYRDEHRSVSPLRPASDAICIDTSALSIEATLREIMQWVSKTMGSPDGG